MRSSRASQVGGLLGAGCRDGTPGQSSSVSALQASPSLCTCLHTSPGIMSPVYFGDWVSSGLRRGMRDHMKTCTRLSQLSPGRRFGVNTL